MGAAEESQNITKQLSEIVSKPPLPPDTEVLVFGSLARGEWTGDGDVDWTLLLDGHADTNHQRAAQDIRESLDAQNFKQPGTSGVFGGMAFSHEIVHYIGGANDSNTNLTRRILLLLESRSLEHQLMGARDRVVRQVIKRYLDDDLNRATSDGDRIRIPRFLLNDVVRFWRTMAVDYASKKRERDDKGWALRNIKLRFSRKLIFVKGLLVCFGARQVDLFEPLIGSGPEGDAIVERVGHLRSLVELPPLQVLAHAANCYCKGDTVALMFGAYERFLEMLGDADQRQELEKLPFTSGGNGPLFTQMKKASDEFQTSLETMFFDTDHKLRKFCTEYGMF